MRHGVIGVASICMLLGCGSEPDARYSTLGWATPRAALIAVAEAQTGREIVECTLPEDRGTLGRNVLLAAYSAVRELYEFQDPRAAPVRRDFEALLEQHALDTPWLPGLKVLEEKGTWPDLQRFDTGDGDVAGVIDGVKALKLRYSLDFPLLRAPAAVLKDAEKLVQTGETATAGDWHLRRTSSGWFLELTPP